MEYGERVIARLRKQGWRKGRAGGKNSRNCLLGAINWELDGRHRTFFIDSDDPGTQQFYEDVAEVIRHGYSYRATSIHLTWRGIRHRPSDAVQIITSFNDSRITQFHHLEAVLRAADWRQRRRIQIKNSHVLAA